jgi:putative nucleotidyltransferase with HDIG domain
VNRVLALHIAWLVTLSALALVVTSLSMPVQEAIRLGVSTDVGVDVACGLAFWIALTLMASALPVTMPRGLVVSTAIAPLVASMVLGGPTAAGWVAALGTTEYREVDGRVSWWGTLANHGAIALPAMCAALIIRALTVSANPANNAFAEFALIVLGSVLYLTLNVFLVGLTVGLHSRRSALSVIRADLGSYWVHLVALVPIAWLMAQIYRTPGLGWWATLLFVVPIFVMRVPLQRVVEMREMFTQTIGALAGAVDARDQYTANHSQRVKEIAVDIGRVMRLPDADLEALEWGGLLHDIGKIGVPDSVLLKQDRLSKDERIQMNRHPTIGANIVAKVERLAPELPIIRHHHEWYNGSGYPDRLVGDEIPRLARVLHVADAFEAMIAQRPYRMRPLTTQQAIDELRKYSGIQFDPVVVDAFMRTRWAEGIADAPPAGEPRPVALLAQAAAHAALPGEGAAADPT